MYGTWRHTVWLEGMASLYVLSGVCQPLLLTVGKTLGVADPSAQLYLLFYYLGPSLWIFQVMNCCASCYGWRSGRRVVPRRQPPWPRRSVCLRAIGLAVVDGLAQGLNYTGSTLAGPTLFAIVYSSVTVWTAVWARLILHRRLSLLQWMAVAWVFLGLTVTAWDSVGASGDSEGQQGETAEPPHSESTAAAIHEVATTARLVPDSSSARLVHSHHTPSGSNSKDHDHSAVVQGTVLVLIGSALHAGIYVWNEALLKGRPSSSSSSTKPLTVNSGSNHTHTTTSSTTPTRRDVLTVPQNTVLQCGTNTLLMALWQCLYTIPHWQTAVVEPIHEQATRHGMNEGNDWSVWYTWAVVWLMVFAATNWLHATCFFYTIQNYKGGSVTAGVLKGLQAVLVFGAAHVVYCQDDNDDDENNDEPWWNVSQSAVCFSPRKAASLVLVVTGVACFALVTPNHNTTCTTTTTQPMPNDDKDQEDESDAPCALTNNNNTSSSYPKETTRLLVSTSQSEYDAAAAAGRPPSNNNHPYDWIPQHSTDSDRTVSSSSSSSAAAAATVALA